MKRLLSCRAYLSGLSGAQVALLLLGNPAVHGQPGTIDPSFQANATEVVLGLVSQPDGKIFVQYQMSGLTRLLRDGQLDSTFTAGIPQDSHITCVAVGADGKIIVGGDFLQVQGVARPCIARLNSDTSLDTAFAPQLRTTNDPPPPPGPPPPPDSGPTNTINLLIAQPDGKVLVGGMKNMLDPDGSPLPKLIRLNADGSIDRDFAPVTNVFKQVFLQPDGKILLLGDTVVSLSEIDSWLIRLNPDGSPDSSFTGPTMSGWINAVSPQDSKLIIAGYFYRVNGLSESSVARLNSDGSLDTSFHGTVWPASVGVTCAISQPDGKVILGGDFTQPNVSYKNLTRLNQDGSFDSTYASTGASNFVWALAFQPDGKLLVGGEFRGINATPIANFARLFGDNNAGPGQFVFDRPRYEVFENGDGISLTVRRIWGLEGNVTVSYKTQDGTAKAGTRYVAQNGIVIFGDGEASHTITIPILDDSLIEDLEFFQVVLGEPTGGASIGNPGVATVSVLDNDGPASLDPSFNLPQGGLDFGVKCIAPQPNGKIVIGGVFEQVGAFGRKGISRLNEDGSVDITFNPGAGIERPSDQAWPRVIRLQSDSKILIAGMFTKYNGTNRNYMARLNSDGSLDTSFDDGTGPNDGQGLVGSIYGLGLLTNGQIIVGGEFNTYSGYSRYGLARLDPSGAVDPTYQPAGAADIVPFGLQSDGKVVYAGLWGNVVARANADGTLDNGSFGVASSTVRQVESLADGNTMVAGNFTSINGQSRQFIARLRSDGSVDVTFNPDLSVFRGSSYPPYIYKFAMQADGKTLIAIKSSAPPAGDFLARLNGDGSLDTDFEPVLFRIPYGDNEMIGAIAVQDDGGILVGGDFQTVNDLPRPYLVRLKGGRTAATRPLMVKSLVVSSNQTQIVLQVRPGKPFVLQASANCVDWSSLTTNNVAVSSFVIVDASAPGAPRRYYRAMQLVP